MVEAGRNCTDVFHLPMACHCPAGMSHTLAASLESYVGGATAPAFCGDTGGASALRSESLTSATTSSAQRASSSLETPDAESNEQIPFCRRYASSLVNSEDTEQVAPGDCVDSVVWLLIFMSVFGDGSAAPELVVLCRNRNQAEKIFGSHGSLFPMLGCAINGLLDVEILGWMMRHRVRSAFPTVPAFHPIRRFLFSA